MTAAVLVAGGAGFLGSHLVDKLLTLGLDVIALDNLSTSDGSNLYHLQGNRHFQLIRGDVRDLPKVSAVDAIFNLASPASPPRYQADPVGTLLTNIIGTRNLLDLANENHCPILQASTSEIYGDPAVHPQREDYWGNVNPDGIRSCYDEGKRAAETLIYDYRRLFNTQVRVARIFNTYGPRMSPTDGRVVSNFVAQALAGTPLTVYGDGSQTRSMCYVDDLVSGLISLMSVGESDPVNLGNPAEVTMDDLARLVITLAVSDSIIVHRPLPEDDPTRRQPDISRARKILNWHPDISLNVGLTKTIHAARGVTK